MSTTTKHLLISITLAAIIFSVMHVIFVRPQSIHDLLLDLRSLLNFLFVYSVGMYFGLKSRGFYEKEKYGKVDQVPFKAKLDLSKDQIIDKLSESVNFVVKKNNDQEVELQSKMSWFSFTNLNLLFSYFILISREY